MRLRVRDDRSGGPGRIRCRACARACSVRSWYPSSPVSALRRWPDARVTTTPSSARSVDDYEAELARRRPEAADVDQLAGRQQHQRQAHQDRAARPPDGADHPHRRRHALRRREGGTRPRDPRREARPEAGARHRLDGQQRRQRAGFPRPGLLPRRVEDVRPLLGQRRRDPRRRVRGQRERHGEHRVTAPGADPAPAAVQPQRRRARVRARRIAVPRSGRRRERGRRRFGPRGGRQRPVARHAARQDPAHRPHAERRQGVHDPAGQSVREHRRGTTRDLVVRPAQPVALLVGQGDG